MLECTCSVVICWGVFGLCGNSICVLLGCVGVGVCVCVCVCVCAHARGVYGVCADPGFYGMLCVCELNFA